MKRVLIALGLALPVLAPSLAAAQDAPPITLGEPTYGGSGCPAGTASALLGPNATAVAMVFSDYAAAAGGPGGPSFDRVSCNISIPVAVPDGYSLAVLPMDFLGRHDLPEGAASTLSVEYFMAGGRGPAFETEAEGPLSADFLDHHDLAEDDLAWSACGADVLLRINSALRTSAAGDAAATSRILAGLGYRLNWRTC